MDVTTFEEVVEDSRVDDGEDDVVRPAELVCMVVVLKCTSKDTQNRKHTQNR